MDMNRRSVLIGIGTAAVSTGAVFGSGAFTQVEADRTVSVAVADDSNAHVGLVDNADVSAATTDGNGDLQIQLDGSLHTSGDGVNRNAAIRVSNESSPSGVNSTISAELDNAFKIVNNADNAVSIDIEVDSGDTNELNAHWYDVDAAASGTETDSTASGTFSGGQIQSSLASGSAIAVAVMVDTDGSASVTNDPQIRVRATDAS